MRYVVRWVGVAGLAMTETFDSLADAQAFVATFYNPSRATIHPETSQPQ